MIKLITAIRNAQTAAHFQGILAIVAPRLCTGPFHASHVIELTGDLQQVITTLKAYFLEDPTVAAVLISDWLVASTQGHQDNALAKACQKEFERFAFGTIAVVWPLRRVTDIDRFVAPACTDESFEHALRMVLDRLFYLAPPRQIQSLPGSVVVRPLRTTNETEVRSYLLLRHRVYRAMGYLPQEVEDNTAGIEVSEADVHSIHVAAFQREGVQEKLVGTARVVTNEEPDRTLQAIFETVVGNDQIAKEYLNTPNLLGLPIFHTHSAMNPIMRELFRSNQRCGELSRVIVAPEFRGRGISRKLIDEALRRSVARGVQRLFLECLQVHEKLYEQHSFRRIPGVVGPVLDVGRTMIAMEMKAESIGEIRARLSHVA